MMLTAATWTFLLAKASSTACLIWILLAVGRDFEDVLALLAEHGALLGDDGPNDGARRRSRRHALASSASARTSARVRPRQRRRPRALGAAGAPVASGGTSTAASAGAAPRLSRSACASAATADSVRTSRGSRSTSSRFRPFGVTTCTRVEVARRAPADSSLRSPSTTTAPSATPSVASVASSVLVLPLVERERVDDGERVLGGAGREHRPHRQAAHLARERLLVRARVRPEDHAAALVVRRALGALARVAGALLAIRLLAAAGHLAAGARVVGALARVGLLGHDGLVHDRLVRLDAEDPIVQVDLAQDLAAAGRRRWTASVPRLQRPSCGS